MDASCLNLNPLDMDWLSCVNSQRRKLLFILSHVTEYLSYVCNQLFPRVSPCITMSKNDFDIINVKNHVNTWIVWESDSFANKGVDSFLYKKKNFRGFLHWEFPQKPPVYVVVYIEESNESTWRFFIFRFLYVLKNCKSSFILLQVIFKGVNKIVQLLYNAKYTHGFTMTKVN